MNRRESFLQRGIDEVLMVFEPDSQGAFWAPNNAANGYKEGPKGQPRAGPNMATRSAQIKL